MAPAYEKMAEWAAWYSGEPNRLIAIYNQPVNSNVGTPWWRFWSRNHTVNGELSQRAMLHVPLASDLASLSGSLLFGEPPKVRVRVARADEVNEEPPPPDPVDVAMGKAPEPKKLKPAGPEDKTEARLLDIIEQGGVYARLVEAAESAAALGGVYIYPVWDKDLRDFPIMAVAQSDMAVPEFKHGILTAVTFHKIVSEQGSNVVTRLLERHEVEGTGPSRKCVVLTGIYEGTADRLGKQVALAGDTLSGPPPEARVELPFPDLDVEYVPNIRPNRLWRAESLGVADIQGSETLLDALDEIYASWMRDIRLAKARIIVPREYLRSDTGDGQPSFDLDQEIYVGMDMDPGLTQDSRTMLAHQFNIRYIEHRESSREIMDRIVSNAGYSPATIGHSSDAGERASGTALRVSEHKTLITLRRKGSWWKHAVENTLYRMLLIDKEIFKSGVEVIRPTVDISDSIIDNPLELAQTALALKTAEAASAETRVRIVHPDWSENEVDAEVIRITNEAEAAKPPPSTIGQFGAGDMATTSQKPITEGPKSGKPGATPPPQVPSPK
jgi:A118 family predicted phage portal protein